MTKLLSMLRRLFAFGVLLATFVSPGVLADARLDAPLGEPLLTVTGNIAVTNEGSGAVFDRAMLNALPQHRIATTTEWTDGVRQFEGPLLREVLAAVGAGGSIALATAVNDYSVEIPLQEVRDYPVILAMRMDGEELTLRTKGPLWVVYPRDDYSELQTSEMNSRWIWQLRSLEIR